MTLIEMTVSYKVTSVSFDSPCSDWKHWEVMKFVRLVLLERTGAIRALGHFSCNDLHRAQLEYVFRNQVRALVQNARIGSKARSQTRRQNPKVRWQKTF